MNNAEARIDTARTFAIHAGMLRTVSSVTIGVTAGRSMVIVCVAARKGHPKDETMMMLGGGLLADQSPGSTPPCCWSVSQIECSATSDSSINSHHPEAKVQTLTPRYPR
jgi:hypothetical protein